jgi:hypothetical protein
MSDRTICGYPVHEAAELFPLITGPDFEALVNDIATNGQMEPVVIDVEGRLLDGRNRARACERLGRKPNVKVYDGDNVVQYVVSHNLHRRHLTDGQRAMIAAKLATRPVGYRDFIATESGQSGDITTLTPTLDQAADLLQVGKSSVQKAKIVHNEGTPELVAATAAGHVPVTTAARVARELQPDEQVAYVEAVKSGADPVKAAPPDLNQQRHDRARRDAKPQRDAFHARTHHITADRVVEEAVSMLESVASTLALVHQDIPSLDAEKRLAWSEALREPLAVINRFKKELKP